MFLHKINSILDKNDKKKSFVVLAIIILNGIIEVVGLAFVLPVIACFDKSVIQSNKYLNYLYSLSNLDNENHFLLLLIIVMVLSFIVKNIFGVFASYKQASFSYNLGVKLANKEFIKNINKGFSHFKENNSNDIVRSVISIPMEFTGSLILPIFLIINEIFVISFIIISILLYNPKIFLLTAFTLLPGFLLFFFSTRKKIQSLGNKKNNMMTSPYKNIFNTILGYADVVLNQATNYFRLKTINSLKKLYDIMTKINVYESIPTKVIELSAIITMSTLFVYFILFEENTTRLLSLLIIFATAAYRIMPSLNRILSSIVKIKSSIYVLDILNDDVSSFQKRDQKFSFDFKNVLEIQSVSKQYENQKVLQKIDLSVYKGDNIGIIGESGSGKTTLINILLGLIIPDSGKLTLDNVLIEENIAGLQNLIGFVQQNIFLIDATLEENIAFGKNPKEIDYDHFEKCLKQAEIYDFVQSLPKKHKSLVGEFGAKISGGQRQRIAIARALYKKPKILILDEATSALDNQTEEKFIKTIKQLNKSGLTIITIAHRLSSLRYCNKIFNISNGIIKQER